jgi:hypothetical protein
MPVVPATQEAEDHSCPKQNYETFSEKQMEAKRTQNLAQVVKIWSLISNMAKKAKQH